MTRFDVTSLDACVVCTHLLANGEYTDGTDAAEKAAAGIQQRWGADAIHLVNDCPPECEGWFATSACEVCRDELHGERHPAALMLPIALPQPAHRTLTQTPPGVDDRAES